MTTSYNTVLGTETADNLVGTSGAIPSLPCRAATQSTKGGANLLFGGEENNLSPHLPSTGATFSGNKGNDTLSIGSLSSNSTSMFGGLEMTPSRWSCNRHRCLLLRRYGWRHHYWNHHSDSTVYGGRSTGTFINSNTDETTPSPLPLPSRDRCCKATLG